MIEQGLDVLPDRRLTDADDPGRIPDMSARVNRNVRNVLELTRQFRRPFALNLWLWKRAMRTREARDDVLQMLDARFNPSPENLRDRRRLLRYVVICRAGSARRAEGNAGQSWCDGTT